MGGSAFNLLLPGNSFPRLPPLVYQALKERLTQTVASLYLHVATPAEAPEKLDHGDLDFIVCTPRESSSHSLNAPHDRVKAALGASHCILEDGNRTSNFAIPVDRGAWAALGCSQEETDSRQIAEDKDIFYQVDIHACADIDEFERIVYFHSYGDLGMIQGLVARNVGLVLGVNGLKYPNPPHPTLILSQDFAKISDFFGWSNERRSAGFKTRREIFKWVAESRFFDPKGFRSSGIGITKVKADRTMYSDFVSFANEEVTRSGITSMDMEEILQLREHVRNEALVKFGRRGEVENHIKVYEARKNLKTIFNGTTVNAWTGLGGNWRGVKVVMDIVRKDIGEEGILQVLLSEGEDGVKELVMNALRGSSYAPKS